MKKVVKKNKSKRIITIIILLLIIVVGIYCVYLQYNSYMKEKNKIQVVFKEDNKVEINSEIKMSDFIVDVVNGTANYEDKNIDTSKLGELTVVYTFTDKDEKTVEKKHQLEVIDTTKPTINAKEKITAYLGKSADLLNGVSVTDNSKEELKAKVIGDYDINSVGEYKLKYEATDSSGNKTEYPFTLEVTKDPNNYTFKTSKGYNGEVKDGVTYIDGVLIANKSYALPKNYGSGLTASTKDAFSRMEAAFNKEKTEADRWLWIASGFRSYSDQSYIYNNYVSRDGKTNADRYSARPGHSEHQSGLAFDLNSITDSFANTYEGKWVSDNCYRFGLILRYPKGKEEITGYMYESWHLRYVGEELAKKLYNNGDWITLEEYYGIYSKYS